MVVDFQGIYMCTVRTHILNEMVPQMQIQHLKPTKCQDVSFAPRFLLQTGWWNFKHFWFSPLPDLGKMNPILTSIFFRWVGSTTNQGGFKHVLCSPLPREMIQFWRAYFSDGLVQPPTRKTMPKSPHHRPTDPRYFTTIDELPRAPLPKRRGSRWTGGMKLKGPKGSGFFGNEILPSYLGIRKIDHCKDPYL